MKIKFAVIIGALLFGSGAFLENSLVQKHLGTGVVASAQEASGKDLFMASCARCHGDNGEGDKGPSLNSAKKQEKWKQSDAGLVEKITKGGFRMPAFGNKLSADQIKAIAGYVRTLPPSPAK